MTYEELFILPDPSPELLSQLGKLVNEIEDLCLYESSLSPLKLKELNAQLTRPTDFSDICSLYGSCDQATFLRCHLLPDPYQYEELADDALIWLVNQCQMHFADGALTTLYGEIIDINLGLTLGTTMTSIHDLDEDASEFLQRLRANKPRVIDL